MNIHVAIIPDGNRRWAKNKGLIAQMGHQKGMDNLENILQKAIDLKIEYMSFWGASWDNLTKRSKPEVNFLLKLFHDHLKKALTDERIHKNQVRVRVIGRWREIFPQKTIEVIDELTKTTQKYKKHNLTFLLGYNGTDEIKECVSKISEKVKEGKIKDISLNTIKENLWTFDLPEVDLVIRTGSGEDPHNSAGFMMWDTAYSQLYFTKTLFPAFTGEEMEKAVSDFALRQRRKGS